ncbi:unnamed protein product [Ambrosiozyma monospora]|uniref:Unnamed protein product n=1 Tax=Ambrosiozyma monospora TaxID=43982 RepID=A0ACB5SQR9_AMBMO|nr:unnamed protein product [Ambrosiozyma monospora]
MYNSTNSNTGANPLGGASTPSGPAAGNTGFTFGQANNTAAKPAFSFGNTDSSKPAASTGFSFGSNSNKSGGNSGFSFGKPAETNKPATGGLSFGSSSTTASTGSKPLFGGSALGGSKPMFGSATDSKAPSSTPAGPKTGFSFGAGAEKKDAPSFSFGAGTEKKDNAAPSFSFGAGAEKKDTGAPSSFSFGAGGAAKKDDASASKPAFSFGGGSSSSATSGFSFGAKPADDKKNTAKPDDSSNADNAKKANTATSSSATDSAKPSGFSFGAKTEEKKPAGFSFGAKTEEKKPAGFSFGAKTEEKKSTETKPATEAKKVSFTASTKGTEGPTAKLEDFKPQPVSILNRNLEDLINKWTGQLSTSSKTFELYSEKINNWDQILVGSSDSIAKLYTDSTQCEQKQQKIDQNLSYIEKQQEELEKLLEGYEKQSETLLASVQQSGSKPSSNAIGVGSTGNEIVLTNDQVREKSYKLAEILELKLESLNTNFSSLISEVNVVSDSFNKSLLNSTTKNVEDEDVLEDVLKLLNNHMESLNWMEKEGAELREKTEELKKKKLTL